MVVLAAQTVEVLEAPSGRGYQLLVQDVGTLDEEYFVSIRQTDSWIDWEYDVGCGFSSAYVPGDEGGSNPWRSRGTKLVVIDYAGGVLEVPIDSSTGRPGSCP